MQPSNDTLVPPDHSASTLRLGETLYESSRSTLLPILVDEPGTEPQLVEESSPRFQLVQPLGRGGIGEVFAANDRDIGRRVAIKRVRGDRRTFDTTVRFVQEIRTTGQLDHPNIVPIHDVGREEDGSLYFVMKYLDGESLESLIARLRSGDRKAHETWTIERRVELFRQVLHAIRFAHARGVIHRDIKPANVMVGHCGEVHVVDWGLAKQISDPTLEPSHVPTHIASESRSSVETRTGSLVGTPLYMAPEQARREPLDQRTDIWQLSLLLYELLTLRHYIEGTDDLGEILTAVSERPIPPPITTRHISQSPIPIELNNIVMKGLARDRSKRYQTVTEMIDALDRRAEGYIEVSCPISFQKWVLHGVLHWIDRHPGLSYLGMFAVGAGALSAAVISAGMFTTGLILAFL